MKDKFLRQTEHEFSPGKRTILLIFAGIIFLGLIPGGIVHFSTLLDQYFRFPHLGVGLFNGIPGALCIAAGFLLGWWSNYVQFTIGRGTPVPIMATQQLIIQKPYSYCRNPMALGSILMYLGVAILIGSISAFGLVTLWTILLLTYIKLVEEKEMELRFGDSYREYRKRTPFIIPRFRYK